MKRYIAMLLLTAVLSAGCGDDKKDEKKDSKLPPASDMFDKAKSNPKIKKAKANPD
jgi:hypothetical protein